jgi:hypothetical protein
MVYVHGLHLFCYSKIQAFNNWMKWGQLKFSGFYLSFNGKFEFFFLKYTKLKKTRIVSVISGEKKLCIYLLSSIVLIYRVICIIHLLLINLNLWIHKIWNSQKVIPSTMTNYVTLSAKLTLYLIINKYTIFFLQIWLKQWMREWRMSLQSLSY